MKRLLILTFFVVFLVGCRKNESQISYPARSGPSPETSFEPSPEPSPKLEWREWDFHNPDICFFVKNEEGENLLDPNIEGNILGNEITVDYNGQVFGMDSVQTRALPPVWYGLRVEPFDDYLNFTPVLKFGEFITTSDEIGFHGETFTINWCDGTSDEVKFDLYITWSINESYLDPDPTVHKKLWFNDELQPNVPHTGDFVINIVK
jgi:hypothetical protein